MVMENQTGPYAPAENVLNVIRRFRDRGLPDVLTPLSLTQVGVPAGNAHRTIAALRFLGLVDEDGRRTEVFNRLRQATTEQYPEQLTQIIREAYSPVFTLVDPATDSDIDINDAFRQYEPQAQREKMIALFRGLCREAGIIQGGPQERRPRTPRPTGGLRQPRPRVVTPVSGEHETPVSLPDVVGDYAPDYRPLTALMQQLPKDGRWTQARRDRWIAAFEANVDLLVEIEGDDA